MTDKHYMIQQETLVGLSSSLEDKSSGNFVILTLRVD